MKEKPLISLLKVGTELKIGSQTIRVIKELGRGDVALSYEVENVTNGTHQVLKIPVPTDDTEWYRERAESIRREARIVQLLNRIEQVAPNARRHIPLCDPSDVVHLSVSGNVHELPAMLIEYARGENLETALMAGEGIEEEIGLRIGCQLADVIALVHLANFQCTDIEPDRLFWDSKHLTVIDWGTARDMTALSDIEKVSRRQEDTRSFAMLIAWIITGQPVPASGVFDVSLSEVSLSPPLRKLLERAISNPSSFGSHPIPELRSTMARFLGYWQTKNAYTHIEQDIQETRREIKFLAESSSPRSTAAKIETIGKIDHFYDQIAIGKLHEENHPWHLLETALNELWIDQLELMIHEIETGHFDVALELVKTLYAYPSHVHRQLLWRKRVAEASANDTRLANERARAGKAIREWDKGTYTLATWVNLDQKFFESLKPQAKESITCLQAELKIATLLDQFQRTAGDNIEGRINIIAKLEGVVPETIDTQLAEARKQVCLERFRLEEQQRRIAKATRFKQALSELEQRVYRNDTKLMGNDFDAVLAECLTIDDRRAVYLLRTLWKRIAEAHQWLEDGQIGKAVQHYITLQNIADVPRNWLQRQIVQAFLRVSGLSPEHETTFGEAFDRIMGLPISSSQDMETLLVQTGLLLPVIDGARRKQYEELKNKKDRVVEYLETLNDEQASPDARIKAFHNLRSIGAHFLDDKLLSDAYGSYAITLQRQKLDQLETIAEQLQTDIQSLRKYESIAEQLQSEIQSLRVQARPIPAHVLEREVAEIERLMPSKEAQYRHHQVWESTAELAKTFHLMTCQRDFFKANGFIEVFRQRCPETIYETIATLSTKDFDSLVTLATEISYLRTILTESPYASSIGTFIEDQRTWMDDRMAKLLAYNTRKDEVTTIAERIIAARRLLVIYDVLGGTISDTMYWEEQDVQHELIANYLRSRTLPIRRMVLRHLSPQANIEDVAHILEQPESERRWPLPAYATTGAMLLIIIGLLFVVVRGMFFGGWTSQITMMAAQSLAMTTPPMASPIGTPSTQQTENPSVQSSKVALESLPITPTPTLKREPNLELKASTGTVELYQGQSETLKLTITDHNHVAKKAQLTWSQVPAGVFIRGNSDVSIEPNGKVVGLDIVVDKDAMETAETIRFRVVMTNTTASAEVPVYLIVRSLPPLMHTAVTINETLQEMLAITVTQNVTLRNEPIIAPETQMEILPVGTKLSLLQLQPQYGFIHVRSTQDGRTKTGWISTQSNFTTYNPDRIKLKTYPPRITVGDTQNPDSQVAFHTSDARDESDMQQIKPQETELLSVLPNFDAQTNQIWLNVRLLSQTPPLEGWVLAEQTNFEDVLKQLAAEFIE